MPAFSDGSLGLPVLALGPPVPGEGEQGWAYRAPAWAVAAAVAPAVAGRPFAIRPVRVDGGLANPEVQAGERLAGACAGNRFGRG